MDNDFIRFLAYPSWMGLFLFTAIMWSDLAFIGFIAILCMMVFDLSLITYLKFGKKKEIIIFGKKLRYGK